LTHISLATKSVYHKRQIKYKGVRKCGCARASRCEISYTARRVTSLPVLLLTRNKIPLGKLDAALINSPLWRCGLRMDNRDRS